MAALKHQCPGDRFTRTSGIHVDCDSLTRDLATANRRMADRRSDDSCRKQLCSESAPVRLRGQSGHLVISAVRDNFHCYSDGTPENEVNLLKTVVGQDVSDDKLRALIARFGSTANLHFADLQQLTEIILDRDQAKKLKSVLQIAADIGKPASVEHPIISNCVDLIEYLQNVMGHCRVETFRVLFLDTHNKIIVDEVLWTGTVSEVQVYPREVMRRALELDASALIAAHNHPSNVVLPSKADIEITKKLLVAAGTLGIAFHDHFIVSAGSYHSMRFHKSVDPWN